MEYGFLATTPPCLHPAPPAHAERESHSIQSILQKREKATLLNTGVKTWQRQFSPEGTSGDWAVRVTATKKCIGAVREPEAETSACPPPPPDVFDTVVCYLKDKN